MITMLLMISSAHAQVDRIKAIVFDKSKVEKLIVAPGLGSTIHFPCELDEAIPGLETDLKVTTSKTNKQILILNFSSSESLPTNLIVRCINNADPYVFDVFPSKSDNQDYLKITSSIGGPQLVDSKLELINSSATPVPVKRDTRRIIELEKPTLVETASPLQKLKDKPTEVETNQRPSGTEELKRELGR